MALIQIEQNHPDLVERTRSQIAIIGTVALDLAREQSLVAHGWLMALMVEGLIDMAMFELLSAERELALIDRLAAPANDP